MLDTKGRPMERKDAHDPRAIANKILEVCEREGRSITLMQLIKLVYLADGWSMALQGRPLSKHNPQAWQYGPVYPTVYKAFKKFGRQKITGRAEDRVTGVEVSESFSQSEEELIKAVVDSYGRFHAFQLSEIMHRPGTPWTQTINDNGQYAEIPLMVMAAHFAQLKKQREVADS